MIKTISSIINDFYALYERGGMPRGISSGWVSLDPFYTIGRGEWTLVTGIPGHGKSAWLDNVIINTARDENWRWLIFSAENQPAARHAAGLAAIYIGRPFNLGTRTRMSAEDFTYASGFLDTQVRFVEPLDHECNITRILQAAEFERFDAMVIDPWNELDHSRPASMTETEYISDALTKVRRFAREKNVHIFIVAHPTKLVRQKVVTVEGIEKTVYPVPTPWDVSGSAHWRNKADNCICVWRDVLDPRSATEIHIQKIRFRWMGQVGLGKLYFDEATGQFIDPLTGARPAFDEGKYRAEIDARIEKLENELMQFQERES